MSPHHLQMPPGGVDFSLGLQKEREDLGYSESDETRPNWRSPAREVISLHSSAQAGKHAQIIKSQGQRFRKNRRIGRVRRGKKGGEGEVGLIYETFLELRKTVKRR